MANAEERVPATDRAATPPRVERPGPDMEKHLVLLAALHLAIGAVLLAVAAFVFVAVTAGGLASRDPDAIAITSVVGISVAAFLSLLALPGLAAGWGLFKRRPWSRILALVVGAMNLMNVPFGTALGIYTIWVLMQDEAVALLGGSGGPPPGASGRPPSGT